MPTLVSPCPALVCPIGLAKDQLVGYARNAFTSESLAREELLSAAGSIIENPANAFNALRHLTIHGISDDELNPGFSRDVANCIANKLLVLMFLPTFAEAS